MHIITPPFKHIDNDHSLHISLMYLPLKIYSYLIIAILVYDLKTASLHIKHLQTVNKVPPFQVDLVILHSCKMPNTTPYLQ